MIPRHLPEHFRKSCSSSHTFDSGTQMVVASRPIGACIEVDRRRFIKSSLVTGSALLANRGFAARIPSQEPVAGAVAPSEIESARFPSDFLFLRRSEANPVSRCRRLTPKTSRMFGSFTMKLRRDIRGSNSQSVNSLSDKPASPGQTFRHLAIAPVCCV